jgi:hypothetical protein
MTLERWCQHLVDETRLAIEHINMVRRDLTVHQKRQSHLTHAREHGIDVFYVRHAGVRVGGRTGRVELAAVHRAARFRAIDFRDLGAICQIQRHQRREIHACWQRGDDAFAISERRRRGRDRRFEIRHHDRARKTRRRERQNGCERCTIAQVQMPVVGAAYGDLHERFAATSG